MSSPCNNCGADFRVCVECDFHNSKYIEKSAIKDIKAEIEKQYKWLMQTKHTLYDIDIAFSGIKSAIDKHWNCGVEMESENKE